MPKPRTPDQRGLSRRSVLQTGTLLVPAIAFRDVCALAALASTGPVAPAQTAARRNPLQGNGRLPKVTGPLRGGLHGFPFASPSAEEVATRRYVMDEFLLEGAADSYQAVPGTEAGRDGLWKVQVDATRPYITRMYVVRPADAGTFNGIVVVNWQNVTAGVDLGSPTGDEIYRGYAWVGVTTQEIAVNGVGADRGVPGLPARTAGLREWDPERYGTLTHPGDAFSYDLFTQAGRLLKAGGPKSAIDPLGGLTPRLIVATGASQSATRLTSYLNAAHPRDRVYDGFLLWMHWGMHQPLVERDHFSIFAPTGDGGYVGSCEIRDDGAVPVLVQSAECEHPTTLPVRQPDTATYRHWEIAGAAHAPFRLPAAPAQAGGARPLAPAIAGGSAPNTINWMYILDAALRSLVRWSETGQPPASQPRIETVNGAITRDRFGNALGGIRVPELEAPTATYLGRNDLAPPGPSGAPSLFTTFGRTTPLEPAILATLYPSRETYVKQWDAAVDRLLASGVLLRDDVDALRARGRAVSLPLD